MPESVDSTDVGIRHTVIFKTKQHSYTGCSTRSCLQ